MIAQVEIPLVDLFVLLPWLRRASQEISPEEKNLHFYLPGSPPHQFFPTEVNSPMVHTLQRKITESTIESDQESESDVFFSPLGSTGPKAKYKAYMTGSEVSITSTPQRLPDSAFPRSLNPKPYQNPGTPCRKVDPPHSNPSFDTSSWESSPALERTEGPFEGTKSESEGEITPTAEPKETPRLKPAPIILPFDPDSDEKPKSPEKLLVKPAPSRVVAPSTKPPGVLTPPGLLTGSLVGSPPKTPLKTLPATPPGPPAPPTGPVPMGIVEEIKNALIESNRVAAMPIPQFYGKKGEKPEDHIMKVKDYFQNYNITDQQKKCDRFRDTCCGKAHTWLSTLTKYPKIFYSSEALDDAAKAKAMKSLFLARWQLKGRTPKAFIWNGRTLSLIQQKMT